MGSMTLLCSCQQTVPSVSLFLYSSQDTFIKALNSETTTLLSQKYTFKTYFAESSQLTQNDQIVNSIEKDKPSLLIVNTVDRLSSSTICDKAANNNLPVIFINREPLESAIKDRPNVYYVGANATEEGKLQAKIAHNLFNGTSNFASSSFDKNKDGKVQLILVKGEQGHQDAEERSKYCISALESYGYDVEIISTITCDWERTTARNEFKKIYTNSLDQNGASNIELVFSNNDDMALGCIDYLKSLTNYNQEQPLYQAYFPIIGVDYTAVGKQSIMANELYGTVENQSAIQADAIYELTKTILNKESFANFKYTFDNGKYIHINGVIRTKDSI
jgi:methyl-galactoside transport system substrate-binding protein